MENQSDSEKVKQQLQLMLLKEARNNLHSLQGGWVKQILIVKELIRRLSFTEKKSLALIKTVVQAYGQLFEERIKRGKYAGKKQLRGKKIIKLEK